MATRNYGVPCLFVFGVLAFLTPLGAKAAQTPTITAVSSQPSTITVGDKVTFTATVTANPPGTVTPTGLVTFLDGANPLGSGILTASGTAGTAQATFSTSAILLGLGNPSTSSITAVYVGDSNFSFSVSAAITLTVQNRNSTSSIGLNPTSVFVGQPSTVTVTVADGGTSFPPGMPNTFGATGAPATGRTGFTATFFGDEKVLVAGGTGADGKTVLQGAEIYSVSGAAFGPTTGNLNTARTGAVAVQLPSGYVLIAGGSSDGTANGALDTAELFDPDDGTFAFAGSGNSTNPNHMIAARFGHTATLLPTGQVLLAGGENSGGVLKSAELYDPKTDTFTSAGNLSTARTGATATLQRIGGTVLIAGGSRDGKASGALDTMELFRIDPITGSGTSSLLGPTLSTPRFQALAAVLPRSPGTTLIAGGQGSNGVALTSGDVILVSNADFFQVSNQMSVGRVNGTAVALPNGEVLLTGGVDAGSPVAELYDFGANRFESTGSLLQSDIGLAATLLNNGQVLMVGLTSGTSASDAELYSPSFLPLGDVALSSSGTGDIFGPRCTLTPSSPTTSTCNTTVKPAVATNADGITASYGGNIVTADLTVAAASTVTVVASSANPSIFGQPVTFTATVTDNSPGSAAAPTGAVQFVVDGANSGTPVALAAASSASSTAALTLATLSPTGSPHTVTANYVNADGNFTNSTATLSGGQTVKAPTTTTVTSSQNPSSFGQAVTFTATVINSAAGSTATPTGTVQFTVDGANLGTPVPLAAGTSTLTIATLPVTGSPHVIAANYLNADGNFINSSASLTPGQMVTQASAMVTVASSANTATIGDTVTFTATVTNSGTGTPTGLVTFFDGTTPLGSGTLNGVAGNDQATFSTAVLNAPPSFSLSHSITAVYEGDANFAASSASSPITETLQGRNSTTSMVVNPVTLVIGQPTTASVTVTDAGTSAPPGNPDNFSITGAPATGRTGFTITPFSDSQILVAGGTDAKGNVLNSAEIYSLSAAGFAAAKGNLNMARTGAVAVMLRNGKVLVAGGSSDGTASGALLSAELFDPIAGTFTPTSHNMTAARFVTTAVLLTNGQVLLAGGENSTGVLSSAELYNPATDTFTATGSLNVARTGAAGAETVRFPSAVIAGGSSDGTANGALDTIELFGFDSTGAGTFRLFPAHLSAARWQPVVAVLQNFSGEVLIAGGRNSTGASTSADMFVFLNAQLTRVPSQMAVGRAKGSALPLSNGRVLLVGGAEGSQVTELFDLRPNKFEAAGSLLQSPNGLLAAPLSNGQVLTVGLTSGGTPASDAELYTPSFNPAGDVFFGSSENGDGLSGLCPLVPSAGRSSICSANLDPVNVGSNPHVLTANAGASSASANITVNQAVTSSSILSSASPSVFAQPVTFTVSVTDSSPGSTAAPTGTVQFVVDGANFGSPVPLVQATPGSSMAVLTTSTLGVSASPHSVTANYLNADGNFVTSATSLSGGQTVNAATTSTVVASSVAAATYGQGVNFTVTVLNNGPGSIAAPTGSVQFLVDAQNFGAPVGLTAGISGTSSATSGEIATLSVNGGSPHAVAAKYLNADANFSSSNGSLSGGLPVNPAHLTVTAFNSAAFYDGATFTFSAFLTGFVNRETETGLRSSGALSGTPGFTGPAVTAVNVGQYTITPTQGALAAANYDFPAANFVNGTLTIVKANTTSVTTGVVTPLNDPAHGATLSFVVVVASTTGGTPTGSVQFTDDQNGNLTTVVPLSVAACPSGTPATASCAKFSPAAGQLATGPQTITASYQGDANFNSTSSGSTPSSVDVTVVPAINTSPGATIPPQVITFENATALAAQNITLSCQVQAAAIPVSAQFPTCSLSSTSLPPSGSITLTLSTVSGTSAGLTRRPASDDILAQLRGARPRPILSALGLPAICFLGLMLLRGTKASKGTCRRVQRLAGLMLSFSILALLVACGGHATQQPPPPVGGTPAGTYLVSVVGADSNHNPIVVATLPLNVQ